MKVRKRVALVVACALIAVGVYSAIPYNENKTPDGGSQQAADAPSVDAEKVAEILDSALTSEDQLAPLKNRAIEADLDVASGDPGEGVSEATGQLANLDSIENVDEQLKLALDMGYIEESQAEEFRLQREGLNALRQAREEAEMTEGDQGGVLP
jgi:hypothetical protein